HRAVAVATAGEFAAPTRAGRRHSARSRSAAPGRTRRVPASRRASERAYRRETGECGRDGYRLVGRAVAERRAGGASQAARAAVVGQFRRNWLDSLLWSLRATEQPVDRKSTRLNSSHVAISYAVFCLKKKNR